MIQATQAGLWYRLEPERSSRYLDKGTNYRIIMIAQSLYY